MNSPIKKASINLFNQPIQAKSRKIKSSFTLDSTADLTAMNGVDICDHESIDSDHSVDYDDFYGWIVNVNKIPYPEFDKKDPTEKRKYLKKYKIIKTYKEEGQETWAPYSPMDRWMSVLQDEVVQEIDKEIIERCKNKCATTKKMDPEPIMPIVKTIQNLFEQNYSDLKKP